MALVDLQLVRECFELHVFRVLTNWRQEPWREQPTEHTPHLVVENSITPTPRNLGFVLQPAMDLPMIHRAIVHIRAWHADRFYPSVIGSSPVLGQFEASEACSVAKMVFGDAPFLTILVISELPVGQEQRLRTLHLLHEAGVDHVIEFPSLLRALLDKIDVNANYDASPTLQTLRLLKRYKLIRNQQLEFRFTMDSPVAAPLHTIDMTDISTEHHTDTPDLPEIEE